MCLLKGRYIQVRVGMIMIHGVYVFSEEEDEDDDENL